MPGAEGRQRIPTARPATWCWRRSITPPPGRSIDEFMPGSAGRRGAAGCGADGTIPPDMQEHTHVFVFNATEDPEEGRIKAGQFADIKRDGEYYTAVFYSKLAARLEATWATSSTATAARNGRSPASRSR